jgi:hypothetical protein
VQNSDAPDTIKSPALSEITNITGKLEIEFDKKYQPMNSIGIGNTNGTTFTLLYQDDVGNMHSHTFTFTGNGLYLFPIIGTHRIEFLEITTNATYVGRIAAGNAVNIPTSIAKEPAFCSTAEPRRTLSGQIIQGAGGYNYRKISLDSRYKINETIMNEIKNGYKYIGMGYPFFIDLIDEAYKLPFSKFYGTDSNQQDMSFEGGARKYLYSKRWEFTECF